MKFMTNGYVCKFLWCLMFDLEAKLVAVLLRFLFVLQTFFSSVLMGFCYVDDAFLGGFFNSEICAVT